MSQLLKIGITIPYLVGYTIPSGNGDRNVIVVGAGLCDGEGERANTALAPHYDSQST